MSPATAYDPDYPLVGETLGLWRLIRGLGRGGMGEVYEAEYDYLHLLTLHYPAEERGLIRGELGELPRSEQARLAGELLGAALPSAARFAIKVCTARTGTAGYKRFLQEADLAQRLGNHPHIVTVHAIHAAGEPTSVQSFRLPDVGKHKDAAYLVMDLARRSWDHNELSIADAVHIVRCIASALDHAHQNGVVHRDLKPENILGSIQVPLLTDFGIAKELDHSLGLTRTGQIIGTLDYMSPEQATDAKSVDHRSDIYSLGVVLYEFTTRGKLPYLHLAEREAALAAIRSKTMEPKWPRQHAPDFPRGLERIVLKAMAHDPADRYQHMSAFIADLDRWQRGGYITPWGRIRFQRWLRHVRNRYPRAITAAMIGGCIVLLLWLVLAVRRWSDTVRTETEAELGAFQAAVERVERREKQQLDGPAVQRWEVKLGQDLAQRRATYPELLHQYESLHGRLAAARWLQACFIDGLGQPVDAVGGMRELELAMHGGQLSGAATADGLALHQAQRLDLGPYGTGAVWINLVLGLHPQAGFQVTIMEASEVRHRTVLALAHGQLSLRLLRDEEQDGQVLWGPLPLPDARHLDLGLAVREDGLAAQLPDGQPLRGFPVDGALRPGSAARVVLDLPQGARLKFLQVLPRVVRP